MFRTCLPQIHRISLLLLTLLLALTGTVQAATPPTLQHHAAQTAPAADWQLIVNAAEGFQIALPPQWQTLNLSAEALGLGLSLADAPDEATQALFDNPFFQRMLLDGMKFMALDLSPAGLRYDLPANVNIIKVNIGSDLPLTALQTLTERQLATVAEPDYGLKSQIITLRGRQALLFQYVVVQTVGFAQSQSVAINQLLVMNEGIQYVVTIGVPLPALDEYTDTVGEMLTSFQLLNGQPAPAPLPTASPTALPTATPIPAVVAVVQIAKLNVRSGPGLNYGILGTVSQNDRLPVTGHAAGRCDWFQVQRPNGQLGWVAGTPTYTTLEGNCNDVPVVPTPPPPPPPAKPCVRFDNHFNKVTDVTLTSPDNPQANQKFNIGPHGRQTQCLPPGRYTISIGVPGIGNINDEFTLERRDGLLVIPIYQAFN